MHLVDGMSVAQIAKKVGISKDVVKYFVDKSNVKEVKLIIKKCKENKSYKEIAKDLGITESKVVRTVKQYGKKYTKKRKASYNPNEIIKLWNQNLTTREIAKKLGISKEAVSKFASRHRNLCPARS
jgi:DNA-binding CsgD family transcriptional regulator